MPLLPGRPHRIMLTLIFNGFEFGLEITTEHDIRAATRHIGSDGHHARPTRLRDDLGFLLVVFRIQHLVLDTHFFEIFR